MGTNSLPDGTDHALGRPRIGYRPELDGIRAFAVALVLAYHFVTPMPFGGYVGVDMFFVLSGYLITRLLSREIETSGRIRWLRFSARRAARLYPALLALVLACLLPGLLLAPSKGHFLLDAFGAVTYLTPVLLLFVHFSWAFRHTWSLGIEAMFSLLWPVLLVAAARVRSLSRSGIAALLILLGMGFLLAEWILQAAGSGEVLLLRAGGLFFGCAVALVGRPRSQGSSNAAAVAGIALLGAGVWIGSVRPDFVPAVRCAVAGTAALVWGLERQWVDRRFDRSAGLTGAVPARVREA